MNKRPFALIVLFALLIAGAPGAGIAAHAFDSSTLGRLAALKSGDIFVVAGFPTGPTRRATIRFEPVSIYSNDAHIYVETASGRKEIARSDRIFLRGYSDDGSARVAIALNRDGSFAAGSGTGAEGTFALQRGGGKNANLLSAQALDTLAAGHKFDFRCANDHEPMDVHALASSPAKASIQSPTAIASHALRLATVAIDTDSLFMSRLFSNNAASAANWIAGMFNTMNLMYERDLLVRLQIGTTILRTNPGTDPYSAFTEGASTAELDIFASYWKTNEAAVSRAFAVLLSGAIASDASGCSTSGLAWVNQYCQKGTLLNTDTVGSYNIDQVCTSIDIDPDGSFDALLVGHELGHNFGAYHTHCTNASTGIPGGTNTIDKCFSGESTVYNNMVVACYSGATSCPAAGAGTIMSYCNFDTSGCAAGTQDLLEFHPTQINDVLLPAITAAPAGCLNTTDDIFFSGFE